MAVRIIVDSSSDIGQQFAREKGIVVLQMTIAFSDGEYVEGRDLTREEFYDKLSACTELPHTSQISPYEYVQAFDEAIEAGDDVLAIVLSSKLSGMYQSALVAREILGERGERVAIVDSENAAIGELVLIERAVELREEGKGAFEIAKILDDEKGDVCLIAALDTLEYLKMGGRISAAAAAIGGLLSVKPVIAVERGEVVVLGRARGSKQRDNLLHERISTHGVDFARPHRLGYSGLSDASLRTYIDDMIGRVKGVQGEPEISCIGPTIGTHIGPGAIGAAFFKLR